MWIRTEAYWNNKSAVFEAAANGPFAKAEGLFVFPLFKRAEIRLIKKKAGVSGKTDTPIRA